MVQDPVVSQSPVILNILTQILGFFGSPESLNDKAFDIESSNGLLSQVLCIDEVVPVPQVCSLHSHPQLSYSSGGQPQPEQLPLLSTVLQPHTLHP